MSEKGEDVLDCLVLSTTQIYSIYCQRKGNKFKIFTFKKVESENLDFFSIKEITQTD